MSEVSLESIRELFLSRLETLSHILDVSINHFALESEVILDYRLVDDMLPFATQIVFTCNQPHNFALWCEGKDMENLPVAIESIDDAKMVIQQTKDQLMNLHCDETVLTSDRRIPLSESQHLMLPGIEYINDFLLPNCYFHLITAYSIMRMKGVPLGKANYMLHLLPKVQHQ